MVGLLVFLKAKGCPFLVILKLTRGSVLEENCLFGIPAFGGFRMTLFFGSCKWGPASCFSLGTSPWKPACSPSFPVFFPRFYLSLFLCLVFLEGFIAGPTGLFWFSASVLYPTTSFMDTFDPNICIGIDYASVLSPVTSSTNALNWPECADIEVFGMPPFVQMFRWLRAGGLSTVHLTDSKAHN